MGQSKPMRLSRGYAGHRSMRDGHKHRGQFRWAGMLGLQKPGIIEPIPDDRFDPKFCQFSRFLTRTGDGQDAVACREPKARHAQAHVSTADNQASWARLAIRMGIWRVRD